MNPTVSVTLPIKLVSVSNLREHWARKFTRNKKQQGLVALELNQWFAMPTRKPPYRIELTRVAPRALDSDNNVSAFKAIRDAIAQLAKVDDRHDDKLRFFYKQEKGPYAVKIVITQGTIAPPIYRPKKATKQLGLFGEEK